MAQVLSVRDAGSWKTAKALWVRDGGSWKQVKALWVRDGGSWKQCMAGQNLLSFSAYVLYGNPATGDVRFQWTANSISGDTVQIEANPSGAGWQAVTSTAPAGDLVLETNIAGLSGFISLDGTDFRAQLLDGGTTPIGDQINIYPTYPYY